MLAGAGSNGAYSAALSTAATEIKELQAEYDSFKESSHQLEKELEDELCRMEQRARASEEEIRRVREKSGELKARLTIQLLECQRELAQVREEKCAAVQMVRDREEALEQAVENERRATAEVESLREALDDSMEMAAFAQTELEDSKTSAEERTKQLYQELEDAHAELALFTPSREKGAIGHERQERVYGCGSGRLSGGSEPEGMLTRKSSDMSSLFEAENSEHEKTPVSNVREGLSPLTYRRLMARADRGLDSDSRNERVSSNHVETPYFEQAVAGKLGEDLIRQLRMCAASPSIDRNLAILRTTKGYESTLTGSVSTCTCCSSQFPHNGGSRSSLDHSSIHGASQIRRASSSSGNSIPVRTGRRQSELVSARTGAGAAMSRPPDDDEETKSENANDAFEIVDGDNEETMSDECDVLCGLSRGVEDTMRALSGWRPFAWCEPR